VTPQKGVYHKVKKGETLWRISKAYSVPLDEVIRVNKIPNVAHIEKNQLVFIPGADVVKQIASVEANDEVNEFSWPIKGRIYQYFGDRNGSAFNNGINILTSEGEKVSASKEGRVVFADYLTGYDHTIILDHADGYYTVYSQNAKLLVNLGDYVFQGDPIANVGKKGDLAFAHFEIRKNSVADNPLFYLP